jgi:hypothetical protein
MSDKENVEVAIQSAIKSLSEIPRNELLVEQTDLDEIVRQSFLYQYRAEENRSEITKSIHKIIEDAIEKIKE